MSNATIEVVLSEDAPYIYGTTGGQTMQGKLPKGLKLIVPAEWVYETATPKRGRVVLK